MPRLRIPVLEWFRIIGNNSGCHQMPERSFFYKGKQFPLCARCTGVFIGQLTAILLGLIGKSASLKTSAVFLGIMGADWAIQEAGIAESNNYRRLATGFLGGYALFNLYIVIIKKTAKLF